MHSDHRFHVLQFVAAACLAVALMGGAEYVPLLKEYPGAFFWVGLFAAVIFLGMAVKTALREEAHAPEIAGQRGMISLIGIVVCGIGLIGFSAYYFWPSSVTVAPNRETAISDRPKDPGPARESPASDIADEKFPGIAVAAAIKLRDALAFRRKYLFSFQDPEGALATFYLPENDVFKFSIKPVNGEVQTLEVPLGNSGIPVSSTIYVTFEAGIAGDYSFMRVTVNGNGITERRFPLRMDLGSRNWTETHLAIEEDGQRAGAFDLLELGRWPATFTRAETKTLFENARAYYKF